MANNPNCDGSHCREETGEVRVYPIGAGGNLILCLACWAHENIYNFNRGVETRCPENFPQHDWTHGESYP